jgi:hypothetical protein
LEAGFERVHPDVGFVQDGASEAAFLVEEGEHEVFCVDLLVTMLDSNGLGSADGFLEFFGKSVEVHD